MNDNDKYFDLDNFDDSLDSREYRRRQPNRRQSSYNGRPVYRTGSKGAKRRNRRRLRNRIIIVSIALLILALFIIMIVAIANGCSHKKETPDVSTSTIEQQGTTAPASQPATSASSGSAASSGNDLSPTYFKTPNIQDDGTLGELVYGIYVWHNTGYELFYGTEDNAATYAETINSFAEKLTSIKVYDMVIPNHTETGLPQRLKDVNSGPAPSTSQADTIKWTYEKLSDKVTPVNAYNYLADHNNEYTYFKSDHHWTGLGAYYAYKAFADTLGMKALDLSTCTEKQIEGFTGSFSNTADGLESDTVHYWEFPYTVSMDLTYEGGNTETWDSPYYPAASAGQLTYGVFIFGDNPLTVLKSSSPDVEQGRRIAVIKESYGNAFVPYLTNNFEEVHVIDFRTFRDNVGMDFLTYCRSAGITDVLYLNGVMSASTQVQLDNMSAMFD